MNILDKIIGTKRKEIALKKELLNPQQLEHMPMFSRSVNSLVSSLSDISGSGIIAEFKRASPSKGTINATASVEMVVKAYSENGAAGISVLTDEEYFKGSLEDLEKARKAAPSIPILRKEFIIDEYQLIEAKAWGADVVLLIAACLSVAEVKQLAKAAHDLGLEVLLEIHGEEELGHICDHTDMVGVNNRDLKTFSVDVNRSIQLEKSIPAGKLRISESGISDVDTIRLLRKAGYSGFLMGENFMKEPDPAIAFNRFAGKLAKIIQD